MAHRITLCGVIKLIAVIPIVVGYGIVALWVRNKEVKITLGE